MKHHDHHQLLLENVIFTEISKVNEKKDVNKPLKPCQHLVQLIHNVVQKCQKERPSLSVGYRKTNNKRVEKQQLDLHFEQVPDFARGRPKICLQTWSRRFSSCGPGAIKWSQTQHLEIIALATNKLCEYGVLMLINFLLNRWGYPQ